MTLIHLTWAWGELLGIPGATVSDEEAARAGAHAAQRLPGLVAALCDGARGVLVLDSEGGYRRDLEPAHTEAHRRWPAPAWRPLRGAVAACGLPVVEPPPYPAGTLLPLGEEAVSLAGKRGSARDVIATVAETWRRGIGHEWSERGDGEIACPWCEREKGDPRTAGACPGRLGKATLTIVSGRSTLAGLADAAAGIHLVRAIHPPTGDAGWSWSEGLKDHYGATAKPPLPSLDPRLVVDWKALVQCGTWHAQVMKWDRSALGEVTAHKLITAHGGALAAVQMAAMVAAKDKLPGVTAPAMMALRWAAERGGAAALRALALHGVREDVPLDVAALLGGERPQEGGEHERDGRVSGEVARGVGIDRAACADAGARGHRLRDEGGAERSGGPSGGSGARLRGHGDADAEGHPQAAEASQVDPQAEPGPLPRPEAHAAATASPRLAPSSAASDTGEGAAEGCPLCRMPEGSYCVRGCPNETQRERTEEAAQRARDAARRDRLAAEPREPAEHGAGVTVTRCDGQQEAAHAEGADMAPAICDRCRAGACDGCRGFADRAAGIRCAHRCHAGETPVVRRDPKPENPKPEEKTMTDQNRTAIVRQAPASAAMATPGDFGAEHMRIVREAFAPTASQAEFEVMWAGAKARGLDPVKKQIFFIKRFDQMRGEDVWASQVSIDGFRSIAASSALYDGQDEPEYEYDDQGRVLLARVRVYRKGVARPFVGVARWNEYVQTKKSGDPTHMWRKMEHTMLSKCAEALGLRKAFPELLSGLYAAEEMSQAENETDPIPRPEPKAPPQLPPSVLTAKALLDRVPRAEDSAAIFEIVKQARAWPKVRGHAWLRLLALSSDAVEVEQTRALFGSDDLPAEVLAKLEEAAAARLSAIEAEQTAGAAA